MLGKNCAVDLPTGFRTPRTHVSPAKTEDAGAIAAIADDPKVRDSMRTDFQTSEDWARQLADQERGLATVLTVTIRSAMDAEMIGYGQVSDLDSKSTSPELAIAFVPDRRHKGYGCEVLPALISWFLEHWPAVQELVGVTQPENEIAIELMRFIGMHDDGVVQDRSGTRLRRFHIFRSDWTFDSWTDLDTP